MFDIDGGVNAEYGMSFEINELSTMSNVLDIYLTGADDKLAWVGGFFYMQEDNSMLANFHANLNGHEYFWQPERLLTHYALYGQGTYAISDDLFFTFGARYSVDEKSDDGGRNLACNQNNGCYPLVDRWGDRASVWPEINALPHDYWVQLGKQIDGIDCVAPMIGCAEVLCDGPKPSMGGGALERC